MMRCVTYIHALHVDDTGLWTNDGVVSAKSEKGREM